MNRPAARVSPAGRGSHTYQLNDEASVQTPANGKVMEEWRFHGDALSSPGTRSLTMSPSKQGHITPSKLNGWNVDASIANGATKSDNLSSPDTLKPCLSPSLSVLGQSRSKRGYAAPLGTTMVLCFVSAFIFIGMLGSRSPVYNLRLVPTLGTYRSYRRLQAEVIVDPFKGGIFGQGSVRMKELPSCDSCTEDYVPCYSL
eukprot:c24771_g2_i1 orf=571-1170(+)